MCIYRKGQMWRGPHCGGLGDLKSAQSSGVHYRIRTKLMWTGIRLWWRREGDCLHSQVEYIREHIREQTAV